MAGWYWDIFDSIVEVMIFDTKYISSSSSSESDNAPEDDYTSDYFSTDFDELQMSSGSNNASQ